MLLQQLDTKLVGENSVQLRDEFQYIFEYLFKILRNLDLSTFIICIHRIQLKYKDISERFLNKLIYHLPQLYGEYKLLCAEAILSSVHSLDDAIYKKPYFIEMLTHRDSALQLVCLKLVYELVDTKILPVDMSGLLPKICDFHSHTSVACRYQMINILMKLYQKYNLTSVEDECLGQILSLCKNTLLKLLLDVDETIRLLAFNFWSDENNQLSNTNASNNTIDRVVSILDKMYTPFTESHYLSYSTNLLLEKTSKSPDYNRFIFENPLSECSFREYNLTPDWRRRHEMMTPLFVESQANDSQSVHFSSLADNQNLLRATQQSSLQFQPTQDVFPSKKAPYNWLTQSSLDTFQMNLLDSSLNDSQSMLLFNTKTDKVNPSQIANKATNQTDQDIFRLRRRFLKDKEAETKFFARKQVLQKIFTNIFSQ
jgi:DNA-dependent protein kinase catalytic subunit